MVSNVESEFPSTSIWYDTHSAQESLETKAMVCHGQVGGEGQLGLSQTVFLHFFHSSFHLIFILLRSYLVAFPYFLSLFRSTNFEGQLGLSQTGLFINFFQSDLYLIVLILMLSHIFFFSFGLPMTSGR